MTGVIQTINRLNRVKPRYRVLICDERGRALTNQHNVLGVFNSRSAAISRMEEAGLSVYCH